MNGPARETCLAHVRQAVQDGNRAGTEQPLPERGSLGYQGAGADPAARFRPDLDAAGGKCHIADSDASARLKLFEIYLGKRPLAEDVDFVQLVERTAGYSGADIKAICGRAATRPFLESVSGAEPRKITLADCLAVIADITPSVNRKDLAKFEEWAAAN